jgi:hypothetical protein
MTPLAGPFAAMAVLLGAGGVAKLLRPQATARALAAASLPHSVPAVRVGALAELGVGIVALAVGGPAGPLLVAAVYLGFVAFLARSMRRARGAGSCGCFGATDAPPTLVHVGFDVLAAAAAAGAALTGWPGVGPVVADQPGAGFPFLVLVGVTAFLGYLTLTALPAVLRVDDPVQVLP